MFSILGVVIIEALACKKPVIAPRVVGRVDVEAIEASSPKPPGAFTCSAKIMDWWEDSLELLDLLCGLAKNKNPLNKT